LNVLSVPVVEVRTVASMIKGAVSGFQPRSEQVGSGPRVLIVWDFRIEQKDPTGQPMPRAAVEMRGRSFIGSINNGDVVAIDAPFNAGQVLQVSRVRNLTSGTMVTAKGAHSAVLSRVIFILILLPFIAFIVIIWSTILQKRAGG
jgi:DNA helicase TIP49 (TBP-interacting protein)